MTSVLLSEYDWLREEAYRPEEFFELVDTLAEKYFYGFTHQLGERLLAGDFTPEELRFLAVQEYPYYASTTWWNAFKLAQSDDLDQQRLLHGPLLDELGTDLAVDNGLPAHSELFLKYCNGIGLKREDVLQAPLVPSVIIAVTELMRIARERPQFEFIACSNLVIEKMRPPFYSRLLETFAAKYNWVPSQCLTFYEVHARHDTSHASIGRRVISAYISSKRDQDAIMSAVFRSLCLRKVMYDGIYSAMLGEKTFLCQPWPNFPREPWPRPVK
jgi:pyrroloquinoline-quinone synthase